MQTDVKVEAVEFGYEDFRYRTPIKFGGVALDRVTILNVQCHISLRNGKRAVGFGSMPLGNVWAFPSRQLSYEQTLSAMKALVEHIAAITSQCTATGHPIELTVL